MWDWSSSNHFHWRRRQYLSCLHIIRTIITYRYMAFKVPNFYSYVLVVISGLFCLVLLKAKKKMHAKWPWWAFFCINFSTLFTNFWVEHLLLSITWEIQTLHTGIFFINPEKEFLPVLNSWEEKNILFYPVLQKIIYFTANDLHCFWQLSFAFFN